MLNLQWIQDTLLDRFINLRTNWTLNPVRSTLELFVWFSVFTGTFYTSLNWYVASVLGTLAGILVTLGGEILHSHIQQLSSSYLALDVLSVKTTRQNNQPAEAFLTCIMGYAMAVSMYGIYHSSFTNIELAFFLATLSGIAFIAASEILLNWPPTRTAGVVLQDRVFNAKSNWTYQPIRSLIEIGTWLGTTYGTYAATLNLSSSLQYGTAVAIIMILVGNVFKKQSLSSHETSHHNESQQYTYTSTNYTLVPFLLLVGYAGSSTLRWIFEHKKSVEVALVLTTLAGVIFLALADILVSWSVTRNAGTILQNRFLHFQVHWQTQPLRSFLESGVWLGVTYGTYLTKHSFTTSLLYGTLSGVCVTLIGEVLKNEVIPHTKTSTNYSTIRRKVLPIPMMVYIGMFGAMALKLIYSHFRRIEHAFILATLTGVMFLVAADVFVIWSPTRSIGKVCQDRIIFFQSNWNNHRVRTIVEALVSFISLYICYYLTNGHLLVSIQTGATAGIVICCVDEVLLEFITKQVVLRSSNTSDDDDSIGPLMTNVPYDILFEIARYIEPRELLQARLCCRQVNNLLTSEASRFWTHQRRSGGGNITRSSSLSDDTNKIIAVRCLVYELLRALVKNLFVVKEYSTNYNDMLREMMEHNHTDRNRNVTSNVALRWVFFNANWIRSQKLMRRRERRDNESMIELNPNDAGYNVFRHFPEQEVYGIEKQDTSTISVPRELYQSIQQDPLKFVAAESLTDNVHDLTLWHTILVILVTMTLILVLQRIKEFFQINTQ